MNYFTSILFVLFLSIGFQSFSQDDFILKVDFPESLQGEYGIALGSFGTSFCEVEDLFGSLKFVQDGTGTTLACDTVSNDLTGKIAIIDRGDCDFSSKVFNAQKQGAIAAIVCNNTDEDNFSMGPGEVADSVTIPSFMLGFNDCSTIRVSIPDSVHVVVDRIGPTDAFSTDQVVWTEDFNGGLNGWVNNSLRCAGVTDPTNATWTWQAGGQIGQGSFVPDGTIIFSNSPCNGAVIFDSDFLDSEGDAIDPATGEAILEELEDGSCISEQEAELISPNIDLSSADPNSVIGIKFIQNVRNFNAEFFVGWSIDGGTSWSETQVNETIESNDGANGYLRIPLAGVSSTDQLMIKFRFSGDYYFWAIDDVSIIEFTGTNANLSSVFYTPLSFAVPMAHADADTFFFSGSVTNEGGTVLGSVRLDVNVVNESTQNIVFEDFGTESDIAVNEVRDIATDNLFVPIGLEPGLYSMNYSISVPDAVETDTTDNTGTEFFGITENIFSKEFAPTTAFSFNVPWKVANLYRMSPNVSGFLADSVSFAVASNAASFTDNFVDVFLLKLNPGIFEGGFADFDVNDVDLFGHPSMEIVGSVTHVFTNEQNFDQITIPLSSSGEGIPVDPGASYFILLQFDGSQAGQATVPNYNIFMGFNSEDFEYNFISTVITLDEAAGSNPSQWYLGGSGPEDAAVIRLSVSLTSSVDDTPLPEGVFNVYPNPTVNYLIADLNFEESQDVAVVMATLEGKILMVKDLENVTNHQERIDLTNYPNGTYLVRVSTKLGTKTHKIIVQR